VGSRSLPAGACGLGPDLTRQAFAPQWPQQWMQLDRPLSQSDSEARNGSVVKKHGEESRDHYGFHNRETVPAQRELPVCCHRRNGNVPARATTSPSVFRRHRSGNSAECPTPGEDYSSGRRFRRPLFEKATTLVIRPTRHQRTGSSPWWTGTERRQVRLYARDRSGSPLISLEARAEGYARDARKTHATSRLSIPITGGRVVAVMLR